MLETLETEMKNISAWFPRNVGKCLKQVNENAILNVILKIICKKILVKIFMSNKNKCYHQREDEFYIGIKGSISMIHNT